MTSVWRGLRRRILTPSTSATKLGVRGFHEKDAESKELLETIGSTFLGGFSHAAEARTTGEAEVGLERVTVRFRGFAYEGAAMGFAIRDALPFGRGDNISRFLAGRGQSHVYMAYVGIGWAMARLPRVLWTRIAPTDPVLRWLALDGYGFHQAYFHTNRYVHERYQHDRFPWPVEGPQWYANRVLDQGVGRALWFVCGTAPALVVKTIETFPRHRWPDLYAGTGLAATYAGGADESELRTLWDAAGDCRPQVAQGAAFAASARLRAGLVVPHNEVATRVFCGMPAAEAAQMSDGNRPDAPVRGDEPAYEVWRRRVANEFVSIGRC
ncbi:DUF1702 family protein [Plantactinospora soyae]|nr:DUF1702 family protein [Plantactinospora soyae]